MRRFIKVMKALSDPNRVRILKMLQKKDLCVCEIQAGLHIAQPTVSKHLRILEDAGLVESSKDGLWVNYRLGKGDRNPYAAAMLESLRDWLNDDPGIRSLCENVEKLNRERICRRQ